MANRPSVILTGGGIGSTVVASRYRRDGPVRWVFIDYGQPAAEQERQAVIAIANALDAPDVTTVRVKFQAVVTPIDLISQPSRFEEAREKKAVAAAEEPMKMVVNAPPLTPSAGGSEGSARDTEFLFPQDDEQADPHAAPAEPEEDISIPAFMRKKRGPGERSA